MFNTIFIITIFLFIFTSVFGIISLFSENGNHYIKAKILFLISIISFTTLGIIWIYTSSFDGFSMIVSTMWGYFYMLSLLLILIVAYLYFSRWRRQWKSFLAAASLFISIILLISIPFIDSPRRIAIDLDLSLLPAHIFIAVIGELLFFFSFAGSILYLIMEWQLRKKGSMKLIYRLPNLETIENFNKWAVSRALILLSLGIILGIIMVLIKFNILFLGTAKEMHIYFSWLIILCVFFIRRMKRLTSHRTSILNILLFIFVMFLFIFTNIFITKGFHGFR